MRLCRQLSEEPGDDMAPGLLPQLEVQGFDGLLPSLLGRKAGPFVPALARPESAACSKSLRA